MKTAILCKALCALALAFVCGCKDQVAETKIKALELRVVSLESNVTRWQAQYEQDHVNYEFIHTNTDQILDLDQRVFKMSNTNDQRITFVLTNMRTILVDQSDFELRLEKLEKGLPKTPGRLVAQHPAKPAPEPMKYGVPESVFNSINAEAIKEFPNDFEMQEYVVKKQINSYIELHQ